MYLLKKLTNVDIYLKYSRPNNSNGLEVNTFCDNMLYRKRRVARYTLVEDRADFG